MTHTPAAFAVCLLGALVANAADATHEIRTFTKQKLTSEFWAEGAHFADFNRDGAVDINAGPYWYQGPDFKVRHEFMPPPTGSFKRKTAEGVEETVAGYDPLGYSKNFLSYTHDFNADGWPDILVFGFPGEDTSWYENPRGREGHWQRHIVLEVTDNESPALLDVTGDGKPEIICNSGGFIGFAAADWKQPDRPWKFHPISPKGSWQRFTHGIGVGDVNGDGRTDFLEKDGWWEQPASLENSPVWKKHEFNFGSGGAQMFAYDVDGDGDNDVITSLAAHGYGLAWFEHQKKDGAITFVPHVFMGQEPKENRYGVKFSQLHALDLVDIDGDGVKDIVTGKRYWAHGPNGDPEPNAEAVLYWFQTVRGKDGVDFVPHRVDADSGVGTQVSAGFVNKDGLPDIVVGNKKGVFVFLQSARKATREEWLKAQPKPTALAAPAAKGALALAAHGCGEECAQVALALGNAQ